MVTTRKIKFNFAENEKVLCYEPDPKKAKVLYETKILECCVGKDSNGRKCPQYLVHFYGWNSSWDRIVKECDIVKDNPQNRSLQRSLAEKAAIGLKGKKLKLNKIPAMIKEIVVNSCANTTTSSSQTTLNEDNDDSIDIMTNHPNYEFDEELTQDQIDRQSTLSDDLDDYHSLMSRTSIRTIASNECQTMSESNTCDETEFPSLYSLTNELKSILDEDFNYCGINEFLYELPVRPNVSEIIDEFHINNNLFLNSNSSEITENENSILTEFKSSVEIYFNALIENNYLFYNEEEKQQYKRQLQHNSEQPFDATKVYGFIHLLRLLVIMSEFLLSTPGMTKKQLKVIVKFIQQFIDYLTKRRHQLMSES